MAAAVAIILCALLSPVSASSDYRLETPKDIATWNDHFEAEEETPHTYQLEVDLPRGVWKRAGGLQIGVHWAYDEAVTDLDLRVSTPGRRILEEAGGDSDTESVFIRKARNGTYLVDVIAYSVPRRTRFTVRAEVEYLPKRNPVRTLAPNLVSLRPRKLVSYPDDATQGCGYSEMAEEGARRCLRFDQTIANYGSGPFELRYTVESIATDPAMYQRLYRSDGTYRERFADYYEFHAAHQHFHYKSFAQSRLWRSNAKGERFGDEPAKTGRKNGFCLIDVIDPWFFRKGDAAKHYDGSGCWSPTSVSQDLIHGISVGWADVYNYFLPGQYIDTSGLEDGFYLLETIADPERKVVETRESDNARSILIRLCGNEAEVVGGKPQCGDESTAKRLRDRNLQVIPPESRGGESNP